MKKHKETPVAGASPALRRRAEARIRGKTVPLPESLDSLSPAAIGRLFHELRVHQIELEMQNEELRRNQAELDASRARYFDLYDLAPVGYVTLSEKGLVLEANLTAASLFRVARSALVRQPITRFILPADQDIYYQHRKLLLETGTPQACELRMLRLDAPPFWARLAATAAQEADGAPVCRVVLGDITEHKRAEAELSSYREHLQEQVAQRTASLEQRTAELRSLASRITLVEQQERRRFATFVHDHVQQSLIGAQLRAALLVKQTRPGPQRKAAEGIWDILTGALEQAHSVCAELASPVLYDFGLAAALRWQGKRMRTLYGMTVRVEADDSSQPEEESVRVLLFQSVRELLLNIVKHARVKTAQIRLYRTDNGIRLEVVDHGVGFDRSKPPKPGASGGFGLFSIGERLEQMGGRMEVTTAPGKGTRVALIVPVGDPHAVAAGKADVTPPSAISTPRRRRDGSSRPSRW